MFINLFRPGSISLILSATLTLSLFNSLAQSSETNNTYNMRPLTSPTVPVTVGGKTITATLANTDTSRAQGLLGWDQIVESQGMLLDFIRPGVFAIHMQGMKFPIDALWIDSNGVIKLIYSRIQPNSGIVYPSLFEVRYCLEIAPGFCKKHGVKEGQKVTFGD
ncbi:MAG: DUF192 domain-containing protein [Desulfomonilaceae bacterium]